MRMIVEQQNKSLGLLIGGLITGVRKHRLTVACTDGVVRIAGLQGDSEGNSEAEIQGRIPMFKGAKEGSLAALKDCTITAAFVEIDEEDEFENAPRIEFKIPGDSEVGFVTIHDWNVGGGFVHLWEKGKQAPSSAR